MSAAAHRGRRDVPTRRPGGRRRLRHTFWSRSWSRSATGAGSAAPLPDHVQAFDTLFTKYIALRDYYGRGGNDLMHRLKVIRREQARAGAPAEHGGELVRPGLKKAAREQGASA